MKTQWAGVACSGSVHSSGLKCLCFDNDLSYFPRRSYKGLFTWFVPDVVKHFIVVLCFRDRKLLSIVLIMHSKGVRELLVDQFIAVMDSWASNNDYFGI